jgi:hypothetical protein
LRRTKVEHALSPARNEHNVRLFIPSAEEDNGLEAAIDQAIAACGGDMRSTIRALIVANEYLESEASELMKAVSHAYTRGRFNTYSG